MLRDFSILTIPGGFSYGDDISAGKILATQLTHHLAKVIGEFVSAGKLVLGICNGFQVLVKAGLLPGGTDSPLGPQTVTLTQNDSARFEDRWVHLCTGPRASAFLPADTVLTMPIAHAEGKLVAADEATLDRLTANHHVAVSYCSPDGSAAGGYPRNPNGSDADIAGLTDATGRILGLMPHPERHVHPTQHPEWTSRANGKPDGRTIFEAATRTASQL
jgi:phosphoribosylformylglycinamidine synthase